MGRGMVGGMDTGMGMGNWEWEIGNGNGWWFGAAQQRHWACSCRAAPVTAHAGADDGQSTLRGDFRGLLLGEGGRS
jgi:hypothetical protein